MMTKAAFFAIVFLMAFVLFVGCANEDFFMGEDESDYAVGLTAIDDLPDFADFLKEAKRVDLGCCVVEVAVRDTPLIGANSVKHITSDFVMTLNAEGHTFNTSDAIRIWGTLEYIGENDVIEIWRGCPFMLFSIGGGGKIDFTDIVVGYQFLLQTSSVLERGRVYHFEFQKSGGWSQEDPNAEFWENFFAQEDLVLPAGEYVIALRGEFRLTKNTPEGASGLFAELKISVIE